MVVLVISEDEHDGAFTQMVLDSPNWLHACADIVVDTLPLKVF